MRSIGELVILTGRSVLRTSSLSVPDWMYEEKITHANGTIFVIIGIYTTVSGQVDCCIANCNGKLGWVRSTLLESVK